MAQEVVSLSLFRHLADGLRHPTPPDRTTSSGHFSDNSVEIARIFYDRNLVANYDVNLEINSKSLLTEHACRMRHAATASETALWSALRGAALGVTFRRQVPIGGCFIGDFVASEVKLVVEVDGSWHRKRGTADARRDRELRRLGFVVVRLPAALVERQLAVAVLRVAEAVAALRGAV